jgi:transmembrane 9 superfamily protein 2/4
MGDRIEESSYELFAGKQEFCKVLCRKQFSAKEVELLKQRVGEQYKVHWVLDNLPVLLSVQDVAGAMDEDTLSGSAKRGYPLGFMLDESEGGGHYIMNHVHIRIDYHPNEKPAGTDRIVGFRVNPFSVRHTHDGASWESGTQLHTCNDAQRVSRDMSPQPIESGVEVLFTYDVEWVESSVEWTERWDVYLKNSDQDIHWLSISTSLLIVFCLTAIIAMILVRTLSRDISSYNAASIEDMEEETGWKLLHGDVFRPPAGFFGSMFLSVCVGSGAQLVVLCGVVLLFAVMGFLSPANRGGMASALLFCWVLSGSVAGYVSASLYKFFKGKAWKRNTLLTSVAFPGSVAIVGFIINAFNWGEGTSTAVPFTTMLGIAALWFGVSVPLVFVGSYYGFRKSHVNPPTETHEIPRMVPPQPWYLHPLVALPAGGLLPFAAVFIELYFILGSIWLDTVYYLFGFLALVAVILVITCAEIAIVVTYFQLVSGDYNWWWRSFLTPASSAAYLMLYAVVFFQNNMSVEGFVPGLLYMGYMGLVAWAFFLLTGCIGFLATLVFNVRIYGSVRIA